MPFTTKYSILIIQLYLSFEYIEHKYVQGPMKHGHGILGDLSRCVRDSAQMRRERERERERERILASIALAQFFLLLVGVALSFSLSLSLSVFG
jgi:hypothetical protein